MTQTTLSPVVRHLRRLVAADAGRQLSDSELLERFAAGREERAFAALFRRHGPLVWSVCYSVLHHRQDTEDAFQATFLLLARRAGSIRKTEAVASWLYRVAHRVATKAGQAMARRRIARQECLAHCQEKQLPVGQALLPGSGQVRGSPPEAEAAWRELQALLNEEVQRLPEKYRAPFIMCCLEGKTGPEAARQLGWKLGTVTGRLTEARKLLQRRLCRRGVALSSVLAAATTAHARAATACAALADGTVKAAVAFTAQAATAGLVSAKAAALVDVMAKQLVVSKLKVATAVLVAVGAITGAGALMHQSLAAKPDAPQTPERKQGDPTSKPPASTEKTAKPQTPILKEAVTFKGRVLDPDGKPMLGAKLLFLERWEENLPKKVWAMSGADGQFQFTVQRIPLANRGWGMPGELVHVMAAAPGYGFAVARLSKREEAADLTLHLVKDDLPIRGRVLNLEGKPVAGVRVRVNDLDPLNAASLYMPKKGDLTAWIAALKANKRDPWDLETTYLTELYSRAFDLLFPPVTTDVDGRFQMHGIGGERLVCLRLEGPMIATQLVNVMTRASEKICLPLSRYSPSGQFITYYGADFEVLAEPTKPVVGIVRDKDTGKPLAGVTVTPNKITNPFGIANFNAELIQTTTDKEGRYRLVGLPKGEDNQLLATTADVPYVPASQKVENTPGLEPVTVDFALRRGIWVKGRVTEKTTGKPLSGGVGYYCFIDDPHSKELPLAFGQGIGGSTREDGSFRIVALPGRGLIAVQVAHNFRYLHGVGADQIKGPRVMLGDMECFHTYPSFLQIPNMNTIVEIVPKSGENSITCDLIVVPDDSVRTLTGIVLGPDGKPLADAQAAGAQVDGASFTVEDLKPNERRLLQFMHQDKKLAGFLIVQGNDKGPLRVRLEPWGTLTGRVVTAEGESLTGVRLVGCKTSQTEDGPAVYDIDMTSPIGHEGRFRIEGLTPGLKYELQVSKQGFAVDIIRGKSKDLTIKAGQTKDLGVVQVKVKE